MRNGAAKFNFSRFGRPALFVYSHYDWSNYTTKRDARPLSFYNLSLPCNLNMNPSQLTSVTAETSKATSNRQQIWLPVEDRQLCRSCD
jgi:hypothetical protein